MNWYAIRTTPHKEFKAYEYNLKALGVESCLPTYKTRVMGPNGGCYKVLPLIRSFLFFRQPKIDFSLLNLNPYTKSVLRTNGKIAEIPDKEIQAMKDHIENRHFQEDYDQARVGDHIVIKKGFFGGKTAEVVEKRNNKIYLSLKSLNIQVIVTLNESE